MRALRSPLRKHRGATDQTNLEIYCLRICSRARALITSAPPLVKYNTSFFVQTPDGATIKAVNLIRLGAATHSFDQTAVPPTFSVVSSGIQVGAPP
jgi:hypothetical protein